MRKPITTSFYHTDSRGSSRPSVQRAALSFYEFNQIVLGGVTGCPNGRLYVLNTCADPCDFDAPSQLQTRAH